MSALDRLRYLSSDLEDRIEKTSRMEISAAVIERTNELIEVVRMVRLLKGDR